MVLKEPLTGDLVELMTCEIADAEYTLLIRQDPALDGCMPVLDISLEQQIEWIRRQRETEGDYFLVIWDRRSNTRIGTISLYDIHDRTDIESMNDSEGTIGKECEFGRLICRGGHERTLEAMKLILDFGFRVLRVDWITCYAYYGNERAIRLYQEMGFTKLCDDTDRYGIPIVRMMLRKV